MRNSIFVFTVASGILSGCVSPLSESPPLAEVTAPVEWRAQLAGDAEIEARWWEAFGDPILADLVEQALANNPDVQIAASRVQQARATERASRGLLLPAVGAVVDGGARREVNAFGQGADSLVAQPSFQASYELDLFGKNAARVAAAEAGTAASAAARDATRLSVSAAMASSYITLLALDARLDVLRQTLVSRAEALKFARDRAENGYSSQLVLRQAEAEYEATAEIIPQVETQIARQENALSVLAGTLPDTVERGGSLASLSAPEIPGTLPSEMLRRRPDIAAAEYRLAAADAQMRAARAEFLPSINLGASSGAAFSDLLVQPIGIWSVGGSVLAPLFQGGRLQAQLDGATAQRDQAAWAYRGAALSAFTEVENRLVTLQKLDDRREALENQQAAVADALRHARNRYRAGYTPYIEQVDAQRALLGVELSLIQLRAERLNATVGLYQALGGAPHEGDLIRGGAMDATQ